MNDIFLSPLRRAAATAASAPKVFALSALIAITSLGAQQAHAADTQFALTCIGTETGSAVNFQYRWGEDSEWRTSRTRPGSWQVISYRYQYPGQNRSPQLELRFDDDMSSRVNTVRQKVKSYAARTKQCESEGASYNFIDRDGELFVVLEDGLSSRSESL
jgi:hypothetical protein